MRKHCGLTRHRSNGHRKVRSLIQFYAVRDSVNSKTANLTVKRRLYVR